VSTSTPSASQGRWSNQRFENDTEGRFEVAEVAAPASVRARGQYEKDQETVCRGGAGRAVRREGGTDVPLAKVEDVVTLVRGIDGAEEKTVETAAANRNGVRESDLAFAASCYVPAGDGWTAITRDWTAKK